MKTSTELKAELAALEAEYENNDAQIEMLKKRQTALRGWGRTLIPAVEQELACALALEADAHLPSVRTLFQDNRPNNERDCVLEKVTAKRITLRNRGTQNTIQFEHNGNEARKWGWLKIHPDDLKKILDGQ